jgi:hypothetical protein
MIDEIERKAQITGKFIHVELLPAGHHVRYPD